MVATSGHVASQCGMMRWQMKYVRQSGSVAPPVPHQGRAERASGALP